MYQKRFIAGMLSLTMMFGGAALQPNSVLSGTTVAALSEEQEIDFDKVCKAASESGLASYKLKQFYKYMEYNEPCFTASQYKDMYETINRISENYFAPLSKKFNGKTISQLTENEKEEIIKDPDFNSDAYLAEITKLCKRLGIEVTVGKFNDTSWSVSARNLKFKTASYYQVEKYGKNWGLCKYYYGQLYDFCERNRYNYSFTPSQWADIINTFDDIAYEYILSVGKKRFNGKTTSQLSEAEKKEIIKDPDFDSEGVIKKIKELGERIGYEVTTSKNEEGLYDFTMTKVGIKSSSCVDDSSSMISNSSTFESSSLKPESSSSKKEESSSSKPEPSSSISDTSSEPESSSLKPESSSSKKEESSSSKPDSKPSDDSSKPDDDTTPDETKTLIKGDANGDNDINVSDISVTAAHIKGIKPLADDQIKAADVNNDNELTVTDISMIASHIKGIKALG